MYLLKNGLSSLVKGLLSTRPTPSSFGMLPEDSLLIFNLKTIVKCQLTILALKFYSLIFQYPIEAVHIDICYCAN